MVLGDYTVKNPTDSARTQIIPIESILVHRQFESPLLDYDIGLVRLSKHADMSKDAIKPVCLPITEYLNTKEYTSLKLLENERGADSKSKKLSIFIDWLMKRYFIDIPGKILQREVKIIEKNECRQFYSTKQTKPGDTGFCANDSCMARSGNPAIQTGSLANANNEIRFIQYGFVLKGLRDCVSESPVIYQSVTYHMYWILNNIKP